MLKTESGLLTMTDNEIIKALECCTGDGLCCECPMWEMLSANCIVELNRLALEIIKRQQAELERDSELNRFINQKEKQENMAIMP